MPVRAARGNRQARQKNVSVLKTDPKDFVLFSPPDQAAATTIKKDLNGPKALCFGFSRQEALSSAPAPRTTLPAMPQAQAAITDTGELRATLAGTWRPLALLLDGTLAATLPARAGQALRHRLPDHLVPSWLDLADPVTGASLLPRPLDLRPLHRLALGPLVREGAAYAGRFTLGWPAGTAASAARCSTARRVLRRGASPAPARPAPTAGSYALRRRPARPADRRGAAHPGAAHRRPAAARPRGHPAPRPGSAWSARSTSHRRRPRAGLGAGPARARPPHRAGPRHRRRRARHRPGRPAAPRARRAGRRVACGIAVALPDTDDALPRQVGLVVSGTRTQLPGRPGRGRARRASPAASTASTAGPRMAGRSTAPTPGAPWRWSCSARDGEVLAPRARRPVPRRPAGRRRRHRPPRLQGRPRRPLRRRWSASRSPLRVAEHRPGPARLAAARHRQRQPAALPAPPRTPCPPPPWPACAA